MELILSSTLSLTDNLRIYYAYEEDSACDCDCATEIIPNNGFSPTIVSARTGPSGICALCSTTGTDNVINNGTNDSGSINFGVSLGGNISISVGLGQEVVAGTDAGFVI